jgi:acetyl-CoA acetyltransferase
MPDAFIAGVGAAGGDAAPVKLAARAAGAALADCGRGREDVDCLVLASAVPTVPRDLELAAAVALEFEIVPSSGAYGAQLGEASGLFAIALAAGRVGGGVTLAGGADCPDAVPYWVPGLRGAPAAEPASVVDPLARRPDWDDGDRAAQDGFALRSYERAGTDAPPTAELLAALKPVHAVGGTVTTGNSAAQVAGGAAVALTREPTPGEPRVRVAGWALRGRGAAAPSIAAAVRDATSAVGREPAELDVIEVHEGSAALCLAVADELGVDSARLNQEGGAIAIGSPGAAAGPAMVARALGQLVASGSGAAATVAMAAPGGQGIALALLR